MVTWAISDGAADWDGPEWAAPERAERLTHHSGDRRALDAGQLILVNALGAHQINAYQFQTAWALGLKSDRETRGLDRGGLGPLGGSSPRVKLSSPRRPGPA